MTKDTSGATYMSPSELGKRIGKSSKTIRRRIQSGEIKAELHQGDFGQEYRIPMDEALRVIEMSGVMSEPTDNDRVNDHVKSEPVRGEKIEEIRLPVPTWEHFQRELNGAVFRAGQLEGQLQEVQGDRERLRTEVDNLKGTIELLNQKLIDQAQTHQEDLVKRLEERDKTVTELVTSWREAAAEKVESPAPKKKGFLARILGK